MRRKDREITDRREIDALLSRTRVCRVAFAVGDEPYILPLSHGYDPNRNVLFFHTAGEGRKIACIDANPRVCFEVEGHVAVKAGDVKGCTWGLEYESVIGYGKLTEIHAPKEKEAALRCIMAQQADQPLDWTFEPKMLGSTCVWRLDIESVTGKRSFQHKSS